MSLGIVGAVLVLPDHWIFGSTVDDSTHRAYKLSCGVLLHDLTDALAHAEPAHDFAELTLRQRLPLPKRHCLFEELQLSLGLLCGLSQGEVGTVELLLQSEFTNGSER